VADIDNDGLMDFVIINHQNNNFNLAIHYGKSNNNEALTILPSIDNDVPYFVDLDFDGDLDIIAKNKFYKNEGTGFAAISNNPNIPDYPYDLTKIGFFRDTRNLNSVITFYDRNRNRVKTIAINTDFGVVISESAIDNDFPANGVDNFFIFSSGLDNYAGVSYTDNLKDLFKIKLYKLNYNLSTGYKPVYFDCNGVVKKSVNSTDLYYRQEGLSINSDNKLSFCTSYNGIVLTKFNNLTVDKILWQGKFNNNQLSSVIPNKLNQMLLARMNYAVSGTYEIEDSLIVPVGQTLTIAPNTKLLFAKGTTLTVDGNLTINAPADKPVVFCSQIPGQQWEGIRGNGTNSINLNNVIIRDAVTGIAGFNTATIQNSKFYDCGKALDLTNPSIVNLTSSSIKDCTEGVSIFKNSTANRISYTISDCRITGKIGNNGRTTGITISNIINGTTVIERNSISNFHYGLCLNYGNARLTQNEVSICNTGVRLFESSPVLYGNKISNNSYGLYTIGYSSPVLNPFGSAATSGGYNRISNNTDRQLYYDANSGILLNDGHNDIFDDHVEPLLVDKNFSNAKSIFVRNNFWGTNFLENRPNLFFNPVDCFVFRPFSTTPYTVLVNPQEIPVNEELNTFDLALKKELADDSEAAYTVYQQVLAEDSLDAKAILPRLEYNSPESDKGRSDVISDLFTAGKINSFIFSSAKAREAVLNKNYTEASSFYLMKLDSADLHNDSLIAKVNLLDIIWQDQGKGAGKAAQLHTDLVCRTEKEYLGKREDLLAELSGEKTGISSENLITDFNLFQNYPNPFNPTTIIRYALPEPGDVKIRIYNIMGALVSELKEGVKNRGLHSITFNGNKVSAGVYIYTLDFNGKTLMTKKMIMVK